MSESRTCSFFLSKRIFLWPRAARMGKHGRTGGSTNKFKSVDQPMKGESDSEGEDDHVNAQEEPADRRGGKMARIEAVSKNPGQAKKEQGAEVGFKNKQRVLMIASRGIIHRFRHLMLDIGKLLPHSTKDAKMESKDRPMVINEICESGHHHPEIRTHLNGLGRRAASNFFLSLHYSDFSSQTWFFC
jgi:hypothetical protein